MDGPLEDIEFLARSAHRVAVLDALADAPRERAVLRAEVDASAPTIGRILFAVGMTVYVVVGVKLEERDLLVAFGDRYRQYLDTVPGFVPRPERSVDSMAEETNAD